jgi:predicted short-subunit dehydrogenase-like oxidoreductase (DUF2520 family)
VAILGRGRVGTSLATALEAAGVASSLASALDDEAVGAALAGADLLILAVPDQAVRSVAERTARSLGDRRAPIVHLSGALGIAELEPLARRGYEVGSFHPLQSFPAPRPPSAFQGVTIAIEGSSERLVDGLEALATALGARARRVPDEHRALYHAAAVMASAYVVTLAAQGIALLEKLGWSRGDALDALVPLMEGTLTNVAASGIPDALSGPLRRGDIDTIRRHVTALSQLETRVPLETYRLLGSIAVRLAVETGLDADLAREIAEFLQSAGPEA